MNGIRKRSIRIVAALALVTALGLAGLAEVGLGLGGHIGSGFAQEATPAAITVTEIAPGLNVEVFAGVPSDRAPGQTVYLARFTYQPGAEIFPHGHPGTTTLAVESGTFGWTLLAGTAHVVQGSAAGATGATEDITEPGTEVILEPGDAIFYEDDVIHTARGAGDGETVILATQILTAGEPRIMPVDMEMGTPVA